MIGTSTDSARIRFPGLPRYLPAVRAFVREVLENGEFGHVDDVPGILLAVQEACVNAVRHGHAGDANRAIELTVRDSASEVEIRVLDGGPGFVIPRMTEDGSDETREGGRGLGIMQAVMDSVAVTRIPETEVTVVQLVKLKGAE